MARVHLVIEAQRSSPSIAPAGLPTILAVDDSPTAELLDEYLRYRGVSVSGAAMPAGHSIGPTHPPRHSTDGLDLAGELDGCGMAWRRWMFLAVTARSTVIERPQRCRELRRVKRRMLGAVRRSEAPSAVRGLAPPRLLDESLRLVPHVADMLAQHGDLTLQHLTSHTHSAAWLHVVSASHRAWRSQTRFRSSPAIRI